MQNALANKYEPRTVQSVSHAIQLLRILAHSSCPVTLSSMSRRVGLTKPAVYNLLNTLVVEGLIGRKLDGGYELDWGAYELAGMVVEAQQLKQAARFGLLDLAKAFHGVALLSVVDRDLVLYLDREQEDQKFESVATIGHRSPLHSTASGKVLLAGLPDREIHRLLAAPLTASTSATHTQPSILMSELSEVRSRGFAACWGEHEPNLASLAVPVRDSHGKVRAALAVAVTSEKLRKSSPAKIVSRLRVAAESAEAQLAVRLQ